MYHLKNKRKLKIVLFECQKVFVQSRNLISKVRNTCETCLYVMLEQNAFII